MVTERIPSQRRTLRLPHRWSLVIRFIWLAIAVAGISLYIAAIPYRYSALNPDCEARPCTPKDQLQVREIQDIGLPGPFVAWYFIVVDSIATVFYSVTSALIIWRRSDERVTQFASVMLLATGLTFGPEIAELVNARPVLLPVLILLQVAGFGFLIIFTYFFPDGRFVPRWTRWVVFVFPIVYTFVVSRDTLGVYNSPMFFGLMLGAAAIGVGGQIYRYRRISTPVERQQTKWVMLGIAGMFTLLVVGIVPTFFNAALLQSDLPYQMMRVLFFALLPSLFLPIALVFSMLRYRLWDVDFIINRTLVYGALTALVAGTLALALLVVARLFENFAGGPLVAVALSAVVSGLTFQSLRRRLQRFVDERFYGIKLDYVEAVKAYAGAKQEGQRAGGIRESFGGYTGMDLLGRGGMGEVYRAQHPALGRTVAIKLMPEHMAGRADAQKRFMREAQTVAQLKHPNVISMYDVDEQDGRPYIVMEFIDGQDLSVLLRHRGHLPVAEALPILHGVAAALDYAHANGVIHRDVKPSNVMIENHTVAGSQGAVRAVLMDFGIAKSYAAGTRLTHSGMIGTLDYISPEQIQGATDVDSKADIYSLGIMTYEMLTGQLPFTRNNPGAIVLAHLMEPAPDPRDLAPDLPLAVAHVVMRAMSKTPEDRFVSAGEMVEQMQAAV